MGGDNKNHRLSLTTSHTRTQKKNQNLYHNSRIWTNLSLLADADVTWCVLCVLCVCVLAVGESNDWSCLGITHTCAFI